jgi:hypothetical protein
MRRRVINYGALSAKINIEKKVIKARILSFLTVLFFLDIIVFSAFAQDKNFKGYRFFINPGHGGHDADDRHISATDFWESEGNLEKGLYLKSLLENEKATVFISRYTNKSTDDLDFAVIDEMANAANVDFFLSIHSNGGSGKINRPLMLYRGFDNKPVFDIAGKMAEIMWQKVFENSNYWTLTEPYFKGDWSFYPNWGKQGLGVFRNLAVPAVMSEGSFHDYLPESWRLKNTDYLHHESQALFRALNTFYGIEKDHNGIASGIVRINEPLITNTASHRNGLNKNKSAKTSNQALQYSGKPLNNAIVKLMPGDLTYKTDSLNNGFYFFENIKPGDYDIFVETMDGVSKDSARITVKSGFTTIKDFELYQNQK